MGGFNGNYLGDVFVLDISTNSCTKVAYGGSVAGFVSGDNASADMGDDTVIALAECQTGMPRLIKYVKGANQITAIEGF